MLKSLRLAKQFIQEQGGWTGDPVTVIEKQAAEIVDLRARIAALEADLAAALEAGCQLQQERDALLRCVELPY